MKITPMLCPSCGTPVTRPPQGSAPVSTTRCPSCGVFLSITSADTVVRIEDAAALEQAKLEREKWERQQRAEQEWESNAPLFTPAQTEAARTETRRRTALTMGFSALLACGLGTATGVVTGVLLKSLLWGLIATPVAIALFFGVLLLLDALAG